VLARALPLCHACPCTEVNERPKRDVCVDIDYPAACAQIEDNFGALAVVPKLTPEVLDKIEKVIESRPDPPASFR
jgi:hypothetical protein